MKNSKSYIIILFCALIFSACTSSNQTKIETKIEHLESYKIIADSAQIKKYVRNLFVGASVAEMQGRYSDAIVDFMHVTKYDTSYIPYFAIAKCLYLINKPDMALDYAIKFYSLNPDFMPNLELLGELYLAGKDYKSAIIVKEKIVALDPSIDNRLEYAKCLENTDINKAVEEYNKLYAETKSLDCLLRLNSIYLSLKNNIAYKENIQKISEFPEQNRLSLFTILYSHSILKDFSGFENTLKLADKSLLSYDFVDFLNLSLEIFNTDTAFSKTYSADILKYIDAKEIEHWRVYYQGAYIAERIGDSARMNKYFSKSISLNDTINNLPIEAAIANMRNKRPEKAVYFLDYGMKKYPLDAIFPLYLSFAYMDLKNLDKSMEYAKTAYKLNSSDYQNSLQIATIFDRLDLKDSSIKYYEIAYPLNPSHPLLNNNYAYLLSELNIDLEKAQKMSALAMEKEPSNSSYFDTYGWIQFKLGKIDSAIEYLIKASKISDDAPDIFEHLGDVYFFKKDIENALLYWKKSLILNPSNKALSEKISKANN